MIPNLTSLDLSIESYDDDDGYPGGFYDVYSLVLGAHTTANLSPCACAQAVSGRWGDGDKNRNRVDA